MIMEHPYPVCLDITNNSKVFLTFSLTIIGDTIEFLFLLS